MSGSQENQNMKQSNIVTNSIKTLKMVQVENNKKTQHRSICPPNPVSVPAASPDVVSLSGHSQLSALTQPEVCLVWMELHGPNHFNERSLGSHLWMTTPVSGRSVPQKFPAAHTQHQQ